MLASLLTSGAEIEYLALYQEFPVGAGAVLGEAIKCSGKLSYLEMDGINPESVTNSEFSSLLSVSHNAVLEQLKIYHLTILFFAEPLCRIRRST